MNFEKLYDNLPDFIKYNKFILDFCLKASKKLSDSNRKSNIIKSQNQLFELLLLYSEVKIKGTSRSVQLLYLELLRFIDNVCNKYDIDYWIDYGTLIGAVRHGGFIPWDDDIDLSIMREDYEKLIEVLPKELERYEYLKKECGLILLREDKKNYYKNIKNGLNVEGNVDLLCTDDSMFLQMVWLKPYIKIDFFPKNYVLDDKLDYFKKRYVLTKYRFNNEVHQGRKVFNTELEIKNNEIGFTNNKTNYMCDSLDTLNLSPAYIYETNKVFPLNVINFEGYLFKCPKDIDHCLSVVFGSNYMHLPEVIDTHNIIPFIESQFNSKEEMKQKFKKSIKYLKEVNDNFE